jgi:hypothetical protein
MAPGFSIADPATLESVADRFGVKTMSRQSVRVGIQYRRELESWVHRTRRTGTLLLFYTQGTPAGCGWEESS